ncbi:ABC transporter ATP-binding protein [Fructobacillus pseudoficulneus]|uniref:ABC transporter ATP-binding protein n=1 Tax=Fructobacillus pseudoficulneus TaxID=220714 RepID=A0A3F3H6R6_9LACO|nr:ABC transporter ATP-binding protein [Fructobacillus pseudoficulneus]GAP02539.1 ABC transporter ATP-binding protein [Fructobacillus pseudoficulneus]SEH47296.1 ABC-2 type transport system ATP-binding protein [Fructobacillus pseudoficulneus]
MITLSHLSKSFGDHRAVSDLSVTLKPGEVLGLIGQNGAGKTTTFRMILNFIEADKGTISWDNQPIDAHKRRLIGFLPEERGLYQKQTIEEQVVYLAQLHGMEKSAAKATLKDWMDRLQVVGNPGDLVQTLSKGNAQKIQMIMALIFDPDFVILDEPFSGLDPVNAGIFMDEIKRLKDRGAMIIFSSHNMDNVNQISDQLLMLKKGKTVLQGPVQAIRESFGRTRLYLETDEFNQADLAAMAGVTSVTKQDGGFLLKLTNEEAGHAIFDKVTANGYIPAFSQQPPTLAEIFKTEVSTND